MVSNSTPLVSIVMPAFDAGQYIAESIQSVLEQRVSDWELIVVDDGSTDNTSEVVARFTDPRIRLLRRENGGQAAARNTGIRHSSAPVVAFLDADDLWLPEKLARQLDILQQTNADLVYSDGFVFYDDGSPERADFFAVVPGRVDGPTMFRLLYDRNRIATLSVVVQRQALERAGFFVESRRFQNCEDYDLWLRLAHAGCSFYGLSDKLMRYRRHSASTTHLESSMLAPMIEVVKEHSGGVNARVARRRIRGLYRDLVTALLAENDLTGARERMRQFAAWDRRGLVTMCQSVLLRLWPARFNPVSRKCLYRIEWRITNLMDKLRSGGPGFSL
jgi:teichuronic acid biosynthesis glycosyltransferase TuaG